MRPRLKSLFETLVGSKKVTEIEGKTIEWIYEGDTPVIIISNKRGSMQFTEEGAKKLRNELIELLATGPEEEDE